MSWMVPSVISTICATLVLLFVYGYLYKKQNEEFLGIWTISWVAYLLRFCFMLFMILGYNSKIFLIGNQFFTLLSSLFLVWGVYLFLEKDFPKIYFYLGGFNALWIVISIIYDFPFLVATLPTFIFMGLVYLWLGKIFIQKSNKKNYYKFMGYAFVGWGIHKIDYPFTRPLLWFGPWGYVLGAIFSLVVAIGILIVYFEDMKKDLKDSENKSRVLLEGIPDLLFVLDRDGKIIDYPAKEKRDLYLSPSEFIGKKVHEIMPRKISEKIYHHIENISETKDPQSFEYELLMKNSLYYYEARLVFNEEDRIIAIIRDITDKKKAEASLMESEAKYQSMMEAIEDLVVITSKECRIDYVNPAMIKKMGRNITGRCFYKDILHQDIPCTKCMSREKEQDEATPHEITLFDGHTYHLLVSPLIHADGFISNIHIFRDITHLKNVEHQLRNTLEDLKYLSFHDKLTGLFNRAFFEEELNRLNTNRQLPLSLILVDVNGLKLTNDAFGHLKGDELLKTVSQILKAGCGDEDIVARIGGDEFAIILPKTDVEKGIKIISRINEYCKHSHFEPVQLSFAMGIATKTEIDMEIDTLFKKAEDVMYKNKLEQKNHVRNAMISSIKEMLWSKSYEIKEHANRVKDLSLSLGNFLGLSKKELDELSLLAFSHDIGKIGIPEELLLESNPLTEHELKIWKKHSETGYHIAKSSPELSVVAEAILAHHEHWDGSGYPQGLKDREIPFIARIISIVDAYDVITHKEENISHEEVIEILRNRSNTQFDPEILEAFITILCK